MQLTPGPDDGTRTQRIQASAPSSPAAAPRRGETTMERPESCARRLQRPSQARRWGVGGAESCTPSSPERKSRRKKRRKGRKRRASSARTSRALHSSAPGRARLSSERERRPAAALTPEPPPEPPPLPAPRPPARLPPSSPPGRAAATSAPRDTLRHVAGGGERRRRGGRATGGATARPPGVRVLLPRSPRGPWALPACWRRPLPGALGAAAARGPAAARSGNGWVRVGGGSCREGVSVVPASPFPGSAAPRLAPRRPVPVPSAVAPLTAGALWRSCLCGRGPAEGGEFAGRPGVALLRARRGRGAGRSSRRGRRRGQSGAGSASRRLGCSVCGRPAGPGEEGAGCVCPR